MKMKSLKFFVGGLGAVALLALGACQNEEPEIPEPEPEPEQDDAYWAALATISSSDSKFTAADNGGKIAFMASGGEVMIVVDCGTDWVVESSAPDVFGAAADTGGSAVTVTAGQNLGTEELSGTVTFLTASEKIRFATVSVTQNAYDTPEITVGTTEWHVPARGALTTEIAVGCSMETWTVEDSGADWLSVETTGTGLRLTAAENSDTEIRETAITVSCSDEYNRDAETVTVTQDAAAYVTVGQDALFFDGYSCSASVTVESNYEWTVATDGSDWLTAGTDSETVTLNIGDNTTGETRKATVTVTAGDGAENVAQALITVTQESYDPADLVLEVAVASAGATVRMPFMGTVDCSVDWGDGSEIEAVTTTSPTHTYSEAGSYRISASGTITKLASTNLSDAEKQGFTAVRQWGTTGLTDLTSAFYKWTNLTYVANDTEGSMSRVTKFYQTFTGCTSLEEISDGLFKYATSATSFYGVFFNCTALKAIPEGLFDNCSAVTTYGSAFYGCSSLTEIPDALFAGSPNVTTFATAFQNCTALKSVPAGIFDDNPIVTDFSNVFYGCSSLTGLPDGLFACNPEAVKFTSAFQGCTGLVSVPSGLFDSQTEVTSFKNLFYECSSLTEIPAGLFATNAGVTDLSYLFYGCSSLIEIPKGIFDGLPLVTTLGYAFSGCSSLTEIPEGIFDSQTLCTNFKYVFYNCWSLTSIREDLFANCPEVTDFSYAFQQCRGLTSVPAGIFSANRKVTNFSGTFYACYNLTCESPHDEITVNGETATVHIYERTADLGYTVPTSHSKCFYNAKSLSDYDDIPSDWK